MFWISKKSFVDWQKEGICCITVYNNSCEAWSLRPLLETCHLNSYSLYIFQWMFTYSNDGNDVVQFHQQSTIIHFWSNWLIGRLSAASLKSWARFSKQIIWCIIILQYEIKSKSYLSHSNHHCRIEQQMKSAT